MESFFAFLRSKKIPSTRALDELVTAPVTPAKLLALMFGALALLCAFALLIKINDHFLVTVPARGGTLTLGVIGAPHVPDPVRATSDTDRGLSALLFSGLLRRDSDGAMVPGLAKTYDISPDGTRYEFHLDPSAQFSDGSRLAASDVAFTFEKLADPAVNPRDAAFWQSLAVETPDETTVIARVQTPNPEIIEKFTVGVLKRGSLNLGPVGTGSFIFASEKRTKDAGVRLMRLVRNKHAKTPALLDELDVRVYANQDDLARAFAARDIDATFDLDRAPTPETPLVATETTFSLMRRATGIAPAYAASLSALAKFFEQSAILAEAGNSTASGKLVLDTRAALARAGYRGPVAIALESDRETLPHGDALSRALRDLGVYPTIKAYNHGEFATVLATKSSELVLMESTNGGTPSGYLPLFALYTKTIPLATAPRAHIAPAKRVRDIAELYERSETWYVKEDRVWKWLARTH